MGKAASIQMDKCQGKNGSYHLGKKRAVLLFTAIFAPRRGEVWNQAVCHCQHMRSDKFVDLSEFTAILVPKERTSKAASEHDRPPYTQTNPGRFSVKLIGLSNSQQFLGLWGERFGCWHKHH